MKVLGHIHLLKASALLAVVAALAATSAQAGAPPADPGWDALPHCTVPSLEGTLLSSARKMLRNSKCGSMAPLRKRAAAARNTVLVSVPRAGTVLAPGTKVLLIVSK
jgi:hypothetical protein